jgi:hypothetical protein
MKRKQIYIEAAQEREVKWLAARRGTSEAFVIREAVARYLADEAERDHGSSTDGEGHPSRAEIDANPLLGILGIAGPGLPKDGSVGHDTDLYGTDLRAPRTRNR